MVVKSNCAKQVWGFPANPNVIGQCMLGTANGEFIKLNNLP